MEGEIPHTVHYVQANNELEIQKYFVPKYVLLLYV